MSYKVRVQIRYMGPKKPQSVLFVGFFGRIFGAFHVYGFWLRQAARTQEMWVEPPDS